MAQSSQQRITVTTLRDKFERGEKLVSLTAYDFVFASILDEAGVDIILVGDSLGCVVQGNNTTLPVTLDEMIYHTKMVVRGTTHAFVVVDMPFMTFQLGPTEALRAAGRLIQEGGAQAVKLEGGTLIQEQIRAIVSAGIPVMGHVGLTPQKVHQFGGYRVQGKTNAAAGNVIADALAVQEAGAFSMVLEGIPPELAADITQKLQIPTIGIGASPACSGQVLVMHDLLGLLPPGREHTPKFVKRYAELGNEALKAVANYVSDVRSGKFPEERHLYAGNPTKVNKEN